MRPSEFKITKVEITNENKEVTACKYIMVFYYEDGSKFEEEISTVPSGVEIDKHFFLCEY